jgi:VanZ family protein
MAVILGLASDSGSAEQTGRLLRPVFQLLFPGASALQIDALHGATRKLAHVVEYAILAGLWFRAFARSGRAAWPAAWRAWLIAVAWAAIDETSQAMAASRTGSPLDVALDASGALAAASVAAAGWRPAMDRIARALLWIAAVGGAAVVALDLLVGAESGALWLTVPAAALALGLWRRRRTEAPPRP